MSSVNPSPLAPVPGSAIPDSAYPVAVSAENSHYTTLMARMHSKANDPAFQPYANRTYAPKERCGACYGVQVGFEAHTAPEAGATLANGRIFSAATNRSAPNFYQGAVDHN
jgi:hypothetical protein